MPSRHDPVTGLALRGTSNTNQRGSAEDRRRRKIWLLDTYASDEPLLRVVWGEEDGLPEETDIGPAQDFGPGGTNLVVTALQASPEVVSAEVIPTARCYRCGTPLWMMTITVDRIIPDCKGGTYRRSNIRPACEGCNSETGGALATSRAHAAAKKRARAKRAKTTTEPAKEMEA